MFEKFGAAFLAAAIVIGSAGPTLAAPAVEASSNLQASNSALAPGGSAGVRAAQTWAADNTTWLVVGAAVAVGIIVLVAGGGNGHHHHSTPST